MISEQTAIPERLKQISSWNVGWYENMRSHTKINFVHAQLLMELEDAPRYI